MSSSIARALISVFDKKGVVEFAKKLQGLRIEIISSSGTAKLLFSNGIKVTEVAQLTNSPEMLDGRVKTLHPKIHGSILADRDKKEHLKQIAQQGIKPIDLVVVNLYPFEEVTLKDVDLATAIENIDIGGPTLLRSAAKNFKHVAIVVNPDRYGQILSELEKNKSISDETKRLLALEAFEHVAHYDVVIANYLRKVFGKE